jgi:hypothetical protein
VAVEAIMAGVARNVVRHRDSVPSLERSNVLSHFDYFSCYLMSQDEWSLVQPVPFHSVAAAKAAGLYTDKDFARPDLGNRHLLHPHIPIVVPLSYSHASHPLP